MSRNASLVAQLMKEQKDERARHPQIIKEDGALWWLNEECEYERVLVCG